MTKLPVKAGDSTRVLFKAMAMDVGKELVAHIEVMYPEAIKATASTFKLSVRNCVHNHIMAWCDVTSEADILAALERHKKHRREWVAAYRKMRKEDTPCAPI